MHRPREDGAALAQHGHVIRDQEGIVEVMRDEHHGPLTGRPSLDPRQEIARLRRGQHRGRLVEDQQGGVAREGLHDFEPLLGAHRKTTHHLIGVERQSRVGADGAHPVCHGATVETPLAAERHVLGHGERRHEREMLVHHADAGGDGVACAREGARHAAHVDAAFVRGQHAECEAHEGALPCPILAEHGVHRAGADGQRRLIEGEH